MQFTIKSILAAKTDPLIEVPPPKVTSPLYTSQITSHFIDDFEIWSELPALSSPQVWWKREFLSFEEQAFDTRMRLVKTLPPSPDHWRPPHDAQMESVWILLAYLALVGPIPVQLCAPVPFKYHGVDHFAIWANSKNPDPNAAQWRLHLIRFTSPRPVCRQMMLQSHSLYSVPIG